MQQFGITQCHLLKNRRVVSDCPVRYEQQNNFRQDFKILQDFSYYINNGDNPVNPEILSEKTDGTPD